MMKKALILILFFNFSNAFALEYTTNFTKEAFEQAQNNGKTVVLYSWNKYCVTCAKQKPILQQAKKDFKEVLFLYIEHTKNKNLLKDLNINFWSTIAVYRDNKQIARSVGLVEKDQIYSLIEKGI
jgi:thiol-disulfide isomerase/thioredoxin